MPAPPSRDSRTRDPQSSPRLLLVIASNGMLRVAGGASSVLVGVYIADLANRGRERGAAGLGTYTARLSDAGLIAVAVENHDAVLLEMIRRIGSRLFAADSLRGLQKIDLEGIDLVAAKRMTRQVLAAVSGRRLGYADRWLT